MILSCYQRDRRLGIDTLPVKTHQYYLPPPLLRISYKRPGAYIGPNTWGKPNTDIARKPDSAKPRKYWSREEE